LSENSPRRTGKAVRQSKGHAERSKASPTATRLSYNYLNLVLQHQPIRIVKEDVIYLFAES